MDSTTRPQEELLRLYDREQRELVCYPGMRREETPGVVRHVSLSGEDGCVLFTRLDAATADRAIADQITYFESIGQDFEWKLYEHDAPADLRARLEALGFEVEDAEAVMVLDLESPAGRTLERPAADVRPIVDEAGIGELVELLDEVWRTGHAALGRGLLADLRDSPGYLSIYGAYEDGRLASAAWINFHDGSGFASLWGGSTRAEFRGRGHYAALLAVRAEEAAHRKARFLTVDASPMSQPILERRGFRPIAVSRACQWRVRSRLSA
jgi:hypothetical protein